MATYDPRIVAQALDDLQGQITRWSSIASEMLATATNTQRHAKEAVDRALHNATIVLDRAKDDEENVKKAISSVDTAIEKCTTAKTTSHQTLQEAQTALEEADATLKKWQAELQKALAWLARAEARLAKAIQELERAQSALRSAEWDLSSAESRYRSCMNDKERSNCSGEATAVSRARAEVASARQWVSAAQQEANAAREEVAQARARVECCSNAVAFSTEAVSLAEESISSSTQAVNSAERSLEFAYAAERLVRIAEKKMISEVEAAETMMSETRSAQEFTDNAAIHLRTADGAEDSAQIYSTSVRKELEYRVQMLYELNRPSLVDSALGAGITVPGQHAMNKAKTITWAEKRDILKKMDRGDKITLDDLEKMKLPISDLKAGMLQEDNSWIQRIIDNEGYFEALKDAREAQDLRDAILATLKAVNYRRSNRQK